MYRWLNKKSILCMIFTSMSIVACAIPPNPYGDVALTDWEYSAINQLKKEGLIDKYAENFSMTKASTREEMGRMVARAIWNRDKASAEDRAIIDKLGVEFAPELSMLGVYVSGLKGSNRVLGEEEGAKANVMTPPGPTPEKWDDRFQLHGFFKVSDQAWRNSGVYENGGESFYPNDGNQPEAGIQLFMNYKINDKWKIFTEDEATREFRTGSYAIISANGQEDKTIQQTNYRMRQLYVQGNLGKMQLTIGQWDYIPAYGAVMSLANRAVSGVQLGYDITPALNTKLTYGYLRENWVGAPLNPYLVDYDANNRYSAIEIDKKLSDKANVKAAFHRIINDKTGEGHNLFEIGADTMLTNKVRFWGTYEQSNASEDNREYMVGIDVGRAQLDKPGTQRLSLRYIYSEPHASVGPSIDYWVGSPVTYNYGFKGPQLNYQLMLDKNISLMLWASSLTPTTDASGHLRTIRAEVDYYF